MPAGAWFWIIYVLCVIFGFLWNNPWRPATAWGPFSSVLAIFVLLFLLGWHEFGSFLH
jgi:hypothetical protein